MTIAELSNQFDVQLQDYFSAKGYGTTSTLTFNEYEKSVFLTKAQEDIIVSLYNGRNNDGIAFEVNEEARRLLSSLVTTSSLLIDTDLQQTVTMVDSIDSEGLYHYAYQLPSDTLFIVYEEAITADYCNKERHVIPVIPVKHDQLHKLLSSPFKRPNHRRCFRLDITNNIVEIISKYQLVPDKVSYVVRYLSKPMPIILEDLRPYGLTIEGQYLPTESTLPDYYQSQVITTAVTLALASRIGALSSYQQSSKNNNNNNNQQ